MIKLTVNNVNPSNILTELINAGISIEKNSWNNLNEDTQTVDEMNLYFEDDVDMVAVQAVIDAHNITPLPELPTVEERLKQAEDTILFLLMGGM